MRLGSPGVTQIPAGPLQLATDFVPRRGLRGGHRMTVFAWGWPRRFPRLPAPLPRYIDVAPDARVMADCYWQDQPLRHPTLLALHGLEGSSRAHYMLGLADKAFHRGFNVVCLNQRNCGGTERLSRGLYHSGLSEDPAAVIRELLELDQLPSLAVVGYSLGGNLALNLAGKYAGCGPPQVRAICAVSPTVDLALCVDALERPENRIYEWNFVHGLKQRMRRKARLFPDLYSPAALKGIRTVREFDERITAPHHGFRDADDYYHRASALRVADRSQIPTLIVSAQDDPFVPPAQFQHPAIAANPHLNVVVTRYGGHCAFVGHANARDDGYWAESVAVDFAARLTSAAQDTGGRS